MRLECLSCLSCSTSVLSECTLDRATTRTSELSQLVHYNCLSEGLLGCFLSTPKAGKRTTFSINVENNCSVGPGSLLSKSSVLAERGVVEAQN